MQDKILNFFSKYIESQLGIVYSTDNAYQLKTRLDEIVKIMGYKNVEELYEKSQSAIDGNLKQLLLDTATNNETYFYRDSRVFEVLSKYIVPNLVGRGASLPIRIWSAASSTGQEPYTIAMCLKEADLLSKVSILASDISSKALKKGEKAVYTQLEVQRGLPITNLVKYFTKDSDNTWAIKPEIKSSIKFQEFNLLGNYGLIPHSYNVIFCRNVLIYQRPEKRIEIINNLLKKLQPNGYIIFGPGEGLHGVKFLKQTEKEIQGTLIYQYVKDVSAVA